MKKQYSVFLEPEVHQERKYLPGNIRQRIKRIIDDLAEDPHPHVSQQLDTDNLDVPRNIELRRIRIDKWRIIYAVNTEDKWIWVWGIRKRPPYDYEDLPDITTHLVRFP